MTVRVLEAPGRFFYVLSDIVQGFFFVGGYGLRLKIQPVSIFQRRVKFDHLTAFRGMEAANHRPPW